MDTSDADKALQYKNEGNEFFKKKDYLQAIESYSKAISNFPHPNSHN
jgi:tetratricopeptide (TPR) repeat protein